MNPALCHLYWNWVRMPDDLMKRGAVMICAGTDLQLFYTICTMMLCRSRFICLSVGSLLSVCLLSSKWRFLCSGCHLCGLVFSCLCPAKVLPPCQHSGQLFCPHLEPIASFFGHPLIEVLAVQLQPNCHC